MSQPPPTEQVPLQLDLSPTEVDVLLLMEVGFTPLIALLEQQGLRVERTNEDASSANLR
jgi:hypothetical protein